MLRDTKFKLNKQIQFERIDFLCGNKYKRAEKTVVKARVHDFFPNPNAKNISYGFQNTVILADTKIFDFDFCV